MFSDSTTSPTAPSPSPTTADVWLDDEDVRPRVLVVRVGDAEYGIPVQQVREVVRGERVTRVPGSPPMLRGIINVRGAVVTVLELSVLLGIARGVTSTSIVLIEHGTRLIGLAVDVVRDVRAQDPAGSTNSAETSGLIVADLDAVALCAPHLLSSEEMGR